MLSGGLTLWRNRAKRNSIMWFITVGDLLHFDLMT